MPWALPLTAFFTASGLQFTGWGKGTWNWGPRVGALLLLVVGDAAFRGTLAGDWLRAGIGYLAKWASYAVGYVLGAGAGQAVSTLIHWLPFALVGVYWMVAWSPWGGERMTWRLGWTGVLLPTFISAIPGFAGSVLVFAFHIATVAGAAIVGGIFALGGGVHL